MNRDDFVKRRAEKREEEAFLKRYPSRQARQAADEAIEKLSTDLPMHVYIDTWIAAYVAW